MADPFAGPWAPRHGLVAKYALTKILEGDHDKAREVLARLDGSVLEAIYSAAFDLSVMARSAADATEDGAP
jgi:hypothetical protein